MDPDQRPSPRDAHLGASGHGLQIRAERVSQLVELDGHFGFPDLRESREAGVHGERVVVEGP